MDSQISTALTKTGINILKTAGTLVVATIASNSLKQQTNETIRSATESYGRIKESFNERKSIEG